jgi:potassium efflux system protein
VFVTFGVSLWILLAALFSVAGAAPGDSIVEKAAAVRTTLQAASTLTEDQKSQAGLRIDEALDAVRETAGVVASVATLRDTISNAPEALRGLAVADAQKVVAVTLDSLDEQSTEQLESALTKQRADLAGLQLTLDEQERGLSQLVAQSRSDAGDLTALQRRLSELAAPDPRPATDDPLVAVDELWRNARMTLLRTRADLINLRQGNIDLLTELARRQRDVAATRVDTAKQQLTVLLDALQQRRQQEATALVSAAEDRSAGALGPLRAVQTDIAGLAREQSRLLVQEVEFQRRLEQVNRTLERLKRDYDRIQQVVELGGSSSQVSTLLQKRRQLAPVPEQLGRQVLDLQQRLSDIGLRQLELDETLQELVDDEAARAFLRSTKLPAGAALGDAGQDRELLELAGIYRQTALELWQNYTRYLAVLSQLEANTRLLAQEAARYHAFIDDRLLWVPSTELIPLSQPALLLDGLRWFISPQNINALLSDAVTLPTVRPAGVALWLLGILLLASLRKRALAGLKRCEEITQKVRTDSFRATLIALFHTLILLALVPWIMVGAGLLLGALPTASNATLIYAAGLQSAGQTILFLGAFRHLCRGHGLAVVHLHWHPRLCEQLGKQASWLLPLAAPLGFLAAAGSATVPSDFIRLAGSVQLENPSVVSLGRLAFSAQMLLLLVAVYRIWRKNGAVMKAFASTDENAKWASYHILWFGPSLLIPLALGTSALLGYFYSAAFLTSVAGITLWFIIGAILARDLLFRGLYVTQRRLRFQEALRYRDEMLAQRAARGEGGETSADGAIKAIEEEKINYSQLGDQVRSLVQLGYTVSVIVGLWWIWRDIFPAFSFLNSVQLPITTSKLIDGVVQDVSLTLSDMVAGLLLGGLALFAAMKVPAVLELTVLQKLPMSRASRYAVTTMTQYVVAVFGVIITFSSLGLQWSNIQWLVAALSVGLGFGLQEIVANFISGIILLFEQPIRVGDVVTVDGTTGTVSKIRIRATTIVNWERQELVIPNKTFITGQLINWTLSDTVNRVFVSVGVGYDTDTRLAMRLMAEVAEKHPNIIADPTYRISFEAFGDNALTLNMRAYLNNMDARLQTISELHQDILDRFREAGVEIAFPQRDVHLSTSEPLELRLHRQRDRGTGEVS